MHKVLEVYYYDNEAQDKINFYSNKGLTITKTENRATSNFLDITIKVRGNNLLEMIRGYEFDLIEFNYMPSNNIIREAKKRAKELIIMGVPYY